MYILALDTSNQALGVAIMKDNEIIGEVVTNIAKNHSLRLMPAMDALMKEVQVKPNELEKIVIAKGPGSYTGVRIGLTTAKTLAWSLNIPIVGVSSLEVLAYEGKFSSYTICPFFDARRGLVFTALYKWIGNELKLVENEQNVLMEDWLSYLKKEQEQVLFLSPDIDKHKETINQVMGDTALVQHQIARPSHLALVGMSKEADATHGLTPNYLRLAEAEANWLKAQKEQNRNG